jgi:glycosyltransferase involved in cell wall biosynthesis
VVRQDKTRKEGSLEHCFPNGTNPGPAEVSIVIPALNEEITIGEFVDWCKEGLHEARVRGQILIVDSSSDRTPEIALAHGAEVLKVPKRGLGRAYIDAIPFIRGQFVVLGDADLTYDFRQLKPFIEKLKDGAEFVMGSRFNGEIEKGAMPRLHRYFGTPLTTWMLNRLYHTHFTDIHCGMRGLTLEALIRIDMQSQSWEYASEMVLRAARLRMKTAEVPVRFYKDRKGRTSHHRRIGFSSPWIAGWSNLKVMLIYSPDSFLLKPGLVLFVLGMGLSISLIGGPYRIGQIQFNLHWMLLGLTCATLGYSCAQIGVLARIIHNLRPGIQTRFARLLAYNRGMLIAGMLIFCGLVLDSLMLYNYVAAGFRLTEIVYSGIGGLLFIIVGFQTFAFTLLIEMVQHISTRHREKLLPRS